VISVIALGAPLTAYTIPAMSVITESAERAGIALVVATTLLNLAWATGETIGAPAAAGISQATSDAVPLLILARSCWPRWWWFAGGWRAGRPQPAQCPSSQKRHPDRPATAEPRSDQPSTAGSSVTSRATRAA